MKIGITGYKGRLGMELVENWECYRLPCDITDENEIVADIKDLRPDVIINCAAITAVDKCEDPEYNRLAMRVNTRGPEYLRRNFRGKLIHISTDYVFDGKRGPYTEKAKPHPINAYGYSKWGGEIVLKENDYPGQTVVVRTTGLYGGASDAGDFASFVIGKAYSMEPLDAVENLRSNQTYIPHLAEALVELAHREWIERFEILNLASLDVISRYEFATMLGNAFTTDYVRFKLNPVKSSDIPGWVAKRPVKGGLKTFKARRRGFPIYSVYDGIQAYKEELGKI